MRTSLLAGVARADADLSRVLLLVIDLQPPFVAAVAEGAQVQRRCELAVRAAQLLELPVAFTEQVPKKLGRTVDALRDAAPGAPAWSKTAFSALGDPAIAAALREREVEHLLLAGVETSVCLYQTALAALDAELQVTLLTDACGARRPDDAEWALRALARAGVHLLPVETVFYALLGDATHPHFKTFTQLVKSHG